MGDNEKTIKAITSAWEIREKSTRFARKAYDKTITSAPSNICEIVEAYAFDRYRKAVAFAEEVFKHTKATIT